MSRIGDLPASQLGRYAENVRRSQGRRTVTMGRLVYHALVLNPIDGIALRCLSDFIAYRGVVDLSTVVLEYALAPGIPLSDSERRLIDEIRFQNMWMCGFSRTVDGRTNMEAGGFWDRSRFEVDEPAYRAFLQPVLQLGGSLEGAFRAAHTLAGAMSGLLSHREGKTGIEEVFHPERFVRAPEYDRWLRQDTAPLDGLGRASREMKYPERKNLPRPSVRPPSSPRTQLSQHPISDFRCGKCGVLNKGTERYCSGCGTRLSA